jgi:23S rRNA (cytidine1920-2'-O)/16S rRNA (cytidine1409-2'-O)-methyltransferase
MTRATMKKRIDQLLVEQGLAETRNQAQALILAGQVLVDEQKIEKPGHAVKPDAVLRILEKLPFASRGGLKLRAAIDQFDIQVAGRVCADFGASTGGFTDCLLQRGARTVHAFDVGHDLLAWKLRTDSRVSIHDGCNARNIAAEDLPADLTLITMDLSFISVTKVLPALKQALLEKACRKVDLIVLVKPQFEVGKGEVGKGGIVREAEKRRGALETVAEFARGLGFAVAGEMPSPITGAKGNEEFLLYLKLSPDL